MFNKEKYKIHFVGIGGIGMSGIAEVLINLGYKVSGSDLNKTDITERLQLLGAVIQYKHVRENILDVDVVVISSAIKAGNPEVDEAKERKIPVIRRAEMLAELMRLKYGIAVAGTHGKTTTTSLLATILTEAKFDPTIVIGGKLKSLESNAVLGEGDFLVAEADESDGSFLNLSPTMAVVTNIDREHMDHYSDENELKESFLSFVNKVPFYGVSVLCLDHKVVQSLIPKLEKRYKTYGISSQADVKAENIEYLELKTLFDVWIDLENLGRIELNMTGTHNVLNCLAAVTIAMELDVPFKIIQSAMNSFQGIQRRFELKGTVNNITVIDDYGHHPKEIIVTLDGVQKSFPGKTVNVLFQPHRYSRTHDLLNEFATCFNQADRLIVTDIYAAGEKNINDISSEILVNKIKEHGHKNVVYVSTDKDIYSSLKEIVKPNDVLITMGAGNVFKYGEEFINL